MASSNTNENAIQCKNCRCSEGDKSISTARTNDNPEKQCNKCPNCQVFKSGALFISSKGIGWTSWKKRWFILTRMSLVFFRSDPNVPPPKGTEPNLTLGGIDLNNSGSVVVRADKKLLTVLFPNGRDGRAITLKAETSEDLLEWKTALENALAQAPSPVLAMGQNGIFRHDLVDSVESSFEQWRDRRPVKSLVVGRPILLALEDIDGSPSFLEKAFRYIEQHGVKVEGILRQSADVEEVERRVQEYEQGRNEFSADEDAHVVGDCIKHVLREMPSSPVPASCCTALVEAYRADRASRINAIRTAISETFPEPNRRLVQRILKMMRIVASHKSENRMTPSAVAACMAPLLLRPLLAGDCEIADDFHTGGDGSIQLMQAAAAANHAQAIAIILLEEYEKIFDEELSHDGALSSDLYTESEDGDFDDDESTDNDIPENDGYHDAENDLEEDVDDDYEHFSSGTHTESGSDVGTDLSYNGPMEEQTTDSSTTSLREKSTSLPKDDEAVESTSAGSNTLPQDTNENILLQPNISLPQHDHVQNDGVENNCTPDTLDHESDESTRNVPSSACPLIKPDGDILPSIVAKSTEKSSELVPSVKRPTVWGRTSARKNLSMESIDYSSEDEIAIQRLEMTKNDLQTKITKELKGNTILQASLERRKEALHERRVALEQDVERLRVQLQKERDLRASLESGLMNMKPGQLSIMSTIDSKTKADLEEIAFAEADIINLKQKVSDLRGQLNYQLKHGQALCGSCSQILHGGQQSAENAQTKTTESTIRPNQNGKSSKAEDISSGGTSQHRVAQPLDMPSSPKIGPSQKQHPETSSESNPVSLGIRSSSSTGASMVGTAGPSQKSPANYVPLLKQQPSTSRSSTSLASSGTSAEEPAVLQKATSKRNSSRVEKSNSRVNSENHRTRTRDSPSSPDKHPDQQQQQSMETVSSLKSRSSNDVQFSEDSASVGRSIGSKKSFVRGENVKKEAQDSVSLAKRQLSQKQPLSPKSVARNLAPSEPPATFGAGASSKKSTSGSELHQEIATPSSTLTKLTNRLNFLKERRVQLANELQTMDTTRSPGPEGPPPRTNSR